MSTQIVKKNQGEITVEKTYDLDKPKEAVQLAVLLKNLVIQQKLYTPIQGKNYVMVEGWQMAGFLTGMKVLSSGSEIKYSATARIFKGETLIGVGYAICSSKESKKKSFDEYAILSMAQTRAIGKAYRNKIGFIMKLAGFHPTPAEEMRKVDETMQEPPVDAPEASTEPQKPKAGQVIGPNGKPTFICQDCDEPITDVIADYSMKIHGKRLCRDCQKEHSPKKK